MTPPLGIASDYVARVCDLLAELDLAAVADAVLRESRGRRDRNNRGDAR